MTRIPVPREEIWRQAYRIRPYLAYLSDDELTARLGDILRNIYTLTAEGKLGALAPDDGGILWAEKLCHVNCEFYRRSADLYDHVRPEQLPFNKTALDLVRRNQHLVAHVRRKGVFCKYGEERWLTELADHGKLRLRIASFYGRTELGIARHDEECSLPVEYSPYDHDLGLVPPDIASLLPHRSFASLRYRKPIHYLYCLTAAFDFRYFVDFREPGKSAAEACLVIHDQDEFERRLLNSIRSAFPNWEISFDAVKYIDPLCFLGHPPPRGLDLFFFKHFRFMYQREYRLVALPRKALSHPGHLDITLQPVSDISELVRITGRDLGDENPGGAGP